MYEIKVEPAFRADYARIMKRHPRLKGEFKEAVGCAVAELLAPIQARQKELLADKAYLEGVFRSGAEKAAYVANRTLWKAQKRMGLAPRKL